MEPNGHPDASPTTATARADMPRPAPPQPARFPVDALTCTRSAGTASRPAIASRIPGSQAARDARRDRGPARGAGRPGERQGVHGEPGGLGRRRPRHIGPCGGRRRGGVRVTVRLHDTLTGELQALDPLEAGHVRIYSCGPTVYGPAHVGNFRSFLFADVLVRYLRYKGLRVTWVMN